MSDSIPVKQPDINRFVQIVKVEMALPSPASHMPKNCLEKICPVNFPTCFFHVKESDIAIGHRLHTDQDRE